LQTPTRDRSKTNFQVSSN